MAERSRATPALVRGLLLRSALGPLLALGAWAVSCAPGLEGPERFGYLFDGGRDAGPDAGVDAGGDSGVSTGPLFNCTVSGPDAGCQALRLFYCSCGSGSPYVGDTVGCHSHDNPQPDKHGLDLDATDSFQLASRLRDKSANVDNQPSWVLLDSVVPDNSYLYVKVSRAKPPSGSRMPNADGTDAGALSGEDIACIRQWVHQAVGAP